MLRILDIYGNLLLTAMGQTLLLALCGLFFACIIGLIVGMMSVIKNKVLNVIAALFVDLIRGVPMIVLAYFIYFGVPYLLNTIIGIGGVMLEHLVEAARQAGAQKVTLDARVKAQRFYERHGFTAMGDIFFMAIAPVEHIVMERVL